MTAGERQQRLRDELRERFVEGPDPSQLRAILSAVERQRDDATGELILARAEIKRLQRELDLAREKLGVARRAIAELNPGMYWQLCRSL